MIIEEEFQYTDLESFPSRLIDHIKHDDFVELKAENDLAMRVYFVNDYILRFRYAIEGYFENDFSYGIDPNFKSESVEYQVEDTTEALLINTPSLKVRIAKRNLSVRIMDTDGNILNEDEKGFTVCIDSNSDSVNESQGQALFNEDGSQSEYLSEMIKFLTDVITKEMITKKFIDEMAALDLLKENAFTLTTIAGEKHKIDGVFTIDEEKLKNLSDEQVLSFYERGFFSTIYSHLTSLAQFNRLIMMKGKFPTAKAPEEKKIITH